MKRPSGSAGTSQTHRAGSRDDAAQPVWPQYCDFSCDQASFGDPAAVGACRREIGVWCAAAKRYNTKHARCLMAQAR